MLDYADAPPQRGDVIPDGSFVPLQMKFRTGGVTYGSNPADVGLLKRSKTSDVVMLDVEATVLGGPHKGRHVFWMMTIDGGERDDRGNSKGANMTKATVRAILESHHGINPSDNSAASGEKRKVESLAALQAMKFVAKLGVEDSDQYGAKNIIEMIVTPNMPEWRTVREAREISDYPAPKPRGHRRRDGGATSAKPSWQTGGAPSGNGSSMPASWQTGGAPGVATKYERGAESHAPASTPQTPEPAPSGGPSWLNG